MDKWLRIIAAVVVAIALGWLAIALDINIGGLIKRILGKKGKPEEVEIKNDQGDVVGETTTIIEDPNPLRDKGEVKLSNGDTVDLPKGMKDTDIESVTKVSTGVHRVKSKHGRITDVFGSDGGGE